MSNSKHRPLTSVEHYLEAILILSQNSSEIKSIDLAHHLGVSKASVSKTLPLLVEQDYLKHEAYGNIELTEKGKKVAEVVFRKHKVLKTFLMRMLGVEEEQAEREACLMEHSLSMSTLEKWENFIRDFEGA